MNFYLPLLFPRFVNQALCDGCHNFIFWNISLFDSLAVSLDITDDRTMKWHRPSPEVDPTFSPEEVFNTDVRHYLSYETLPTLQSHDFATVNGSSFNHEQLHGAAVLHRELDLPTPLAVRFGQTMPSPRLVGHPVLRFISVVTAETVTTYGVQVGEDDRVMPRRHVKKAIELAAVGQNESQTDAREYEENPLQFARKYRRLANMAMRRVTGDNQRVQPATLDELHYLHRLAQL